MSSHGMIGCPICTARFAHARDLVPHLSAKHGHVSPDPVTVEDETWTGWDKLHGGKFLAEHEKKLTPLGEQETTLGGVPLDELPKAGYIRFGDQGQEIYDGKKWISKDQQASQYEHMALNGRLFQLESTVERLHNQVCELMDRLDTLGVAADSTEHMT